jgi:hypothetical protein
MKTLLTICALAAGAGLYATSDSAQADHCRYGSGYGGGYRYTSPVYSGSRYYGSGHRHHHHHDHGYYNGGYNRGYGYGGYNRGYNRGYYGGGNGFAIRTPGFGLYIR